MCDVETIWERGGLILTHITSVVMLPGCELQQLLHSLSLNFGGKARSRERNAALSLSLSGFSMMFDGRS